jgi:hypothetical protein
MINFRTIKLNAERINARRENVIAAQKFLDSEILRATAPFVPLRTGTLVKSGTIGTVIGSGKVKYIAPYARRQYYENKGSGLRGKLWFERSKAKNKAAWISSVEEILKNGK